jgi:hypothetical protein
MTNIIVTTPKQHASRAAQEAQDCIAAGGGSYFRKFPPRGYPKDVGIGDRVYYVLDGVVRGFCLVEEIRFLEECQCDTSGVEYGAGTYIFMDAKKWQWIFPYPMAGFQGFRYASPELDELPIIGGWLDPMPEDIMEMEASRE